MVASSAPQAVGEPVPAAQLVGHCGAREGAERHDSQGERSLGMQQAHDACATRTPGAASWCSAARSCRQSRRHRSLPAHRPLAAPQASNTLAEAAAPAPVLERLARTQDSRWALDQDLADAAPSAGSSEDGLGSIASKGAEQQLAALAAAVAALAGEQRRAAAEQRRIYALLEQALAEQRG